MFGGGGGSRTRVQQGFHEHSHEHLPRFDFGAGSRLGAASAGPIPMVSAFASRAARGHFRLCIPGLRQSPDRLVVPVVLGLLGHDEFRGLDLGHEGVDLSADGGGISVVVSFFPADFRRPTRSPPLATIASSLAVETWAPPRSDYSAEAGMISM